MKVAHDGRANRIVETLSNSEIAPPEAVLNPTATVSVMIITDVRHPYLNHPVTEIALYKQNIVSSIFISAALNCLLWLNERKKIRKKMAFVKAIQRHFRNEINYFSR